MTEDILSNLRVGNTFLASVQNDINFALNAAPEDLATVRSNIERGLKCAGAHFDQALSDIKTHRDSK